MNKTQSTTGRVTLDLPIADAAYLARAGIAAASKDDITPVITGVLMSATDGVVKVVATDRYRVHRAKLAVEGAELTPFLIPRKALAWLDANKGFFGRPRSLIVEPVATFDFEPGEYPMSSHSTGIPAPEGTFTVTIRENSTDDASQISYRTALIKGNFPGIESVLDAAIAAEDATDTGYLNMDFLSGCRQLADYRRENPRIRFVKTNEAKAGQVVVTYSRGVALVQMAQGAA